MTSAAASKAETGTSFGLLNQIDAGLLNVGHAEASPVGGQRPPSSTART
jgi:hypothetical protein